MDAKLLAAVYLELKGGRERRLELTTAAMATAVAVSASRAAYGQRPRPLQPRSTDAEREAHAEFIRKAVKNEDLWSRFGL